MSAPSPAPLLLRSARLTTGETADVLVAEGRIAEASRIRDVQGWFEPLVEGLASGPPLWRVEQMLAVHRAGLLTWAGPAPVVEAEEHAFTAHSPQVGAQDSLGPPSSRGPGWWRR